MSGISVSGSLIDKIVIDRNGIRETIVPTNHADNASPVPFSLEVYFTDADTADGLAQSMKAAADSDRASAIVDAAPVVDSEVVEKPVELGLAPLSNGLGYR